MATLTTYISTLSLHDALPIFMAKKNDQRERPKGARDIGARSIEGVEASDLPDERGSVETDKSDASTPSIDRAPISRDRKSTRLNSSHQIISYAVFCLKKKKK